MGAPLEEEVREEEEHAAPLEDRIEVVPEEESGEEDIAEAELAEEDEQGETLIYDITKPELLEILLMATDMLENLSSGKLTVSEAIAIYSRDIESKLATAGKTLKVRGSRGSRRSARSSRSRRRSRGAK